MNQEPNDPKLCLAVARMLPSLITAEHGCMPAWKNTERDGPVWHTQRAAVTDTEWLYVAHLVEQTLKDGPDAGAERYRYAAEVYRTCPPGRQPMCATFNQRARALCAVKGVGV